MPLYKFHGFSDERYNAKESHISIGYRIGNSNKYMLFDWYVNKDTKNTQKCRIDTEGRAGMGRFLKFNLG